MRKDGKSQYQLKKDKLQKIKLTIEETNKNWKFLRAAKTEEEQKYWSGKVKIASEIIKEIWEIVKDE